MRYPRTKKAITVAAISAAALIGGGITAAYAATGGGGDNQEQAISGTIKAPAGAAADGKETSASEKAQADQLSSLAKISFQEAKAAAEKATGGTATEVGLDDENGFVVYEVEVATAAGETEVTIDAGSGAVLAKQVDNESDTEGRESLDSSGAPDAPAGSSGPQQSGNATTPNAPVPSATG